MKKRAISGPFLVGFFFAYTALAAAETIPVTAKNFAQAETAWNFNNWANKGADKDLLHLRQVSPVGSEAPTVRMNWDTLYSIRIVKVTDDGKFSIILPETDLYVSAQVMDENGYSPYFLVEKGRELELPITTDYALIIFRTELKDRTDEQSLKEVHSVQNQIVVSGMMNDSTYLSPDFDQQQLEQLRATYKEEFLNAGIDYTYAKGPGEADQHILDLSHAAGWGGYPPELGVSNAYSSSKALSGDRCQAVTFEDPENKFFTSFTLYDTDGYLMDGPTHINSNMWKPNENGTITLHFNCGDDAINNLSSGGQPFNYSIRNYGVSRGVLDGKFRPLEPESVSN
ncbi:MAG: hypothetical protein AAF362_10515 [Pseudomonadota bacterium]